MKDEELHIKCWNCQTTLPPGVSFCPACGSKLLSVNTQSAKEKAETKERIILEQNTVPGEILFVMIMTGLGGLGGIVFGLILFQQFYGLFPDIVLFFGCIELFLIIGIYMKSYLSYIGLFLLVLLSLLVDLLVALVLYSTPLNTYQTVTLFQETFLSLMIAIIMNIAVIFSLLVNGRYFQKVSYNKV